ncbi:hypothetical protein SpCBS45565_g01847 [Spizellomyces sp. 'palustris']|nr:hypothetical protein SpCBS45565_g01847 [Spizellomyces sp. 'palustris']
MSPLPPELLTSILQKTKSPTTHHNPTLYACLQVSKTFYLTARNILWDAPRIGTRIQTRAWRGFVDAVLGPYKDFVHVIEDVWLVVGGEDDDDDGRRDSGIDMFKPYSLQYVLYHMVEMCVNVHTVRLHLHCDVPYALPWKLRIGTLRELEVYMRVDDGFLERVFEGRADRLEGLVLHSTGVSARGFERIQKNAPGLKRVVLAQAPRSRHSVYSPVLDPHAIAPFLESHRQLTEFHITPLPNLRPEDIQSLPHTLQSLTLTLSTGTHLTVRTITTVILPPLTHLQSLKLLGNTDPEAMYMSDGVVSEQEVLEVPTGTSRAFRRLVLAQLDLYREEGFKEFYGRGMPWAVDALMGRWRARWKGVELVVEG